MNIKDWWNRLLSKFGKKNIDEDTGPAMELVAEEAPEPVPERKTSDEMIVEMAESTLVKEEVRMQEEIPVGEPQAEEEILAEEPQAEEEILTEEPQTVEEIPDEEPQAEEMIPEEEEIPEQEEDPWYEEETDYTGKEE